VRKGASKKGRERGRERKRERERERERARAREREREKARQFLCLAAAPQLSSFASQLRPATAPQTLDWPFGADHTISKRTPDPSSRPSDPFLHLEGRESTLDPRNEKTASSLDPPTEGREVKGEDQSLLMISNSVFFVLTAVIVN